jgi:hypothetical protein
MRRALPGVGGVALLAALASLLSLASPAFAATVIVAPKNDPYTVPNGRDGTPVAVTVKATGFTPGEPVYLIQCDGTLPSDNPAWAPNKDCDLETAPAAAVADAHGTVVFATTDRNRIFRPVRGVSPERLFNCVAPGETLQNEVKSYTTCHIRVSTNNVTATADQVFRAFRFEAPPGATTTGGGSGDSGSSGIAVVVTAAGVLALAVVIVLVLRRRRTRAG